MQVTLLPVPPLIQAEFRSAASPAGRGAGATTRRTFTASPPTGERIGQDRGGRHRY